MTFRLELVRLPEELRRLRNEALGLVQTFLRRLIINLDENLSSYAATAEQRIEDEGFPILCDSETWTLHGDGVCQALWFRRVKAEKTLAEIEPNGAIGAVQFFLTTEEHVPFSWPA
jgi:hypothetical protein